MKETMFFIVIGGFFYILMKLFVISPPQESIIQVGHCYQSRHGDRDKIIVIDKLKFGYKYRINDYQGYARFNEYDLVEMDCYD